MLTSDCSRIALASQTSCSCGLPFQQFYLLFSLEFYGTHIYVHICMRMHTHIYKGHKKPFAKHTLYYNIWRRARCGVRACKSPTQVDELAYVKSRFFCIHFAHFKIKDFYLINAYTKTIHFFCWCTITLPHLLQKNMILSGERLLLIFSCSYGIFIHC